MHVFPTDREKLVTYVIASFLIGVGVGLAAVFDDLDSKVVIPAIATLVAAFIGAWIAFALESKSRAAEKRERDLDAANRILYVLYERLNTIKLFQIDFVNPTRDNPAQMISMGPVHDFRAPSSEFEANEVSFLFKTSYKPLMLSLHVVNEQFHEAVNAIRVRSHLHLNVYQPLLERAGYQMGQEITNVHIENAIGERNYQMLRQSTEAVVHNVDTFVERGDQLRSKLISAFADLFSENEVFMFELLDEPIDYPR